MSSKLGSLSLALALGLSVVGISGLLLPEEAAAQQQRQRDRQAPEDDTAADRAKDEEEWGTKDLRLEKRRADGDCPYVKVLYEAARYHEINPADLPADPNWHEDPTKFREVWLTARNTAKWTGQINGIASDCAYRGDAPIEVAMIIGFSLGRGPKADDGQHTYRYWVAVTDRDNTVIAKEYFDLPVNFNGQQKVDVATRVENIVIPRADSSIQGSNFEILVGFDVTPEMVVANRSGTRLRMQKVQSAN